MSTLDGTGLSRGAAPLGVLAFRGADAAKFLQGQLSADVAKLEVGSSTLAGLHNAQGRVVALLGLVRNAGDEILAALPVELIETVTARLAKLVFRSKVRIEDASARYSVVGAATGPPNVARIAWGTRSLLLVPRDVPEIAFNDDGASADWDRADILEGLPQVVAATSESFVAQMLNLDLLGAIAFDKGCYTGQEVIARAHYRGRVKRRLQRWRNDGAALAPGDPARTPDGRALTVVRAGPHDGRGQELLAVGTFAAAGGGDDSAPAAQAPIEGAVVTGPLPLPYALPD